MSLKEWWTCVHSLLHCFPNKLNSKPTLKRPGVCFLNYTQQAEKRNVEINENHKPRQSYKT